MEDASRVAPPPSVLVANDVASSILVPIHGKRPLGLIGADSRARRCLSAHDAAFLAAAANVVAVAHGRLEAEAAVHHRATHDALTGLPNRALLLERLDQVISSSRTNGEQAAVLLIALDGFRRSTIRWVTQSATLCCRRWPNGCAAR